MSKQKQDAELADYIQMQLTNLRQKRIGDLAGSRMGKQFRYDLGHGRKQNFTHGEDEAMLALVLSDAIKGIDIFEVYPDFCRKIIANQELLELFVEAVDLLEPSEMADSLPDMTTTPSELHFLQQKPQPAQPIIQQQTDCQWEVVWQQTITFLETLFFQPAPSPSPAMRRLNTLVDAPQIDLISSDFIVEGTKLKVILQASRPLTQPDTLHLSVWAFVADLAQAMDRQLSLKAQLRWGSYDETIQIPSNSGQAQFPPLHLTQILDETYAQVTAELHLIITNDPG